MPDQFSFGFDESRRPQRPKPPVRRPKATDRLFFAIFPDGDTAARIARLSQGLRDRNGLSGRPLATDRFHITLRLIGDFTGGLPEPIVAAASDAAAGIAAAPFEVAFDYALSFTGKPGNLPFVLRGGEGLMALMEFQRGLIGALARAGFNFGPSALNFTPHVTLLYDSLSVAQQAIEPIAWTATEFVLVRSLLGQTRHIPLERWPLRG
jgi:2'-5' RNA ligase